ncbi:phosphotransferase family protein [Bacillus sp. Marseille-Q1617]|uniref:phosphotransferase family protein n=1 Tax=Bacillus sp. Marseille-Q1617 TaxID=2736887 RepID=UPI0015888908|nr:aminoglycoside phosphotransferase family protein [Bacillus sp. Marseille-Q1617]
MKAGWERSNEWIMPDLDEVRNMLKPYFKDRFVKEIERLDGGLNNSNIKIKTNLNEYFVLRIYNKRSNNMKIETEIARLLQGRVPVPQTVYADSSCSVFKYPFLLMNWMEGEQFSEMIYRKNHKDIRKAAHAAGAALADIHKIRFPDSGFFDDELNIKEHVEINASTFIGFILEMVEKGFVSKYLGKTLCSSVVKFVQEHVYLMDDPGVQNSLVHSDFNPLNVLVEEKGGGVKITILDWEYAFSGSPLMDIGNMLRYEGTTAPGMLKPFIQSYLENGGGLPENWLQKAKLLDLIALLDLLNKEKCGEVRVKDIKGLIMKMMDEWEGYEAVQRAFE